MSFDPLLVDIAKRLGSALAAQKALFACAESCTGGLIAASITEIAGSSGWFDRAFVTYSNEAKMELLGVPATLLAAHGAVSEECAGAMVDGVLRSSRAQLGLSVTGIAGPGGGQAGKPVGTVYFGFATRDGFRQIHRHHFDGDRGAVRQQSALYAMDFAYRLLTEKR